jgi:hypothetical protein
MTKRKDKAAPIPSESEIGFDEALSRSIQTHPNELGTAIERIRQGQAEVEKRANEIRENIRRGLRQPGRKLGI